MPTLRRLSAVVFALAALAGSGTRAQAASRIKDIVSFEGVRENKLVGYGLVVGLNGTGDSLRNAPFTKQSLESMLERLGVNTRDATSTPRTCGGDGHRQPARLLGVGLADRHHRLGHGRLKSLLGGTLLVTPLLGADGEAYAVAQGTVQTGAISAGGASGSSITRGVPTSGKIANGGGGGARDRLPARQHGHHAADAAQPRLHHRLSHRRRGEPRLSGLRHRRQPDHRQPAPALGRRHGPPSPQRWSSCPSTRTRPPRWWWTR